ncbi:MAG: hypothetical protein M1480_17840 [Bacteroidetes bacterium]|nr:hypothetical protein [Bacteroidota bacterium]
MQKLAIRGREPARTNHLQSDPYLVMNKSLVKVIFNSWVRGIGGTKTEFFEILLFVFLLAKEYPPQEIMSCSLVMFFYRSKKITIKSKDNTKINYDID